MARRRTLRDKETSSRMKGRGMVQAVVARSGTVRADGNVISRKALKEAARANGWEIRKAADGKLEAVAWVEAPKGTDYGFSISAKVV